VSNAQRLAVNGNEAADLRVVNFGAERPSTSKHKAHCDDAAITSKVLKLEENWTSGAIVIDDSD